MTNSPCKDYTKCMENSMKNMCTDVRVKFVEKTFASFYARKRGNFQRYVYLWKASFVWSKSHANLMVFYHQESRAFLPSELDASPWQVHTSPWIFFVSILFYPDKLWVERGKYWPSRPWTQSEYSVFFVFVFFSRFANAMVYYGVFMSAPYIGGSMHFNFFLASVTELPAITAGIWIYNRLEKKFRQCYWFVCQRHEQENA